MTANIQIDIIKNAAGWPEVEPLLKRAVKGVLDVIALEEDAELSLVLSDNDEVQLLNKHYRGKDKPTNVLSFPQDDENFQHLGDVILALETVKQEAQDQDKSFDDHLTHLTIHGLLHLLGYDHETDDEAEEMEALEIEILRDLGVKNPYETQDTVA